MQGYYRAKYKLRTKAAYDKSCSNESVVNDDGNG